MVLKKFNNRQKVKIASVTLAVTGALIAMISNDYTATAVFFTGIGFGCFIMTHFIKRN